MKRLYMARTASAIPFFEEDGHDSCPIQASHHSSSQSTKGDPPWPH